MKPRFFTSLSAIALAACIAVPAAADDGDKGVEFSLGFIALARDGGTATSLLSNAGGTVVSSSGSANWHYGAEAQLNIPVMDYWGLDFRGIVSIAPTVTTSGSNVGGIGFADFDGFGNNGLFGPTTIFGQADRELDFYSFEANVTHDLTSMPITLFGGLRYIHIGDDLDLLAFTPNLGGGSNRALINVSNDLIGAQIGIEAEVIYNPNGPWSLDVLAAIGYYHNSIDASVGGSGLVLGTPAAGPIVATAAQSSSSSTFGVELGVEGGYQFNENMSLNMGYNLIYFDKIASSTRTLASVNTGVPPVFVTGPGFEDALYHGLTLDFTYKFLPN